MDFASLPDQLVTSRGGPACHGPYQHQPHETFIAPARRTAMLTQALAGVELGTWDHRILQWLCHWCDTPTFLAIHGMLQRAHQAGAADPRQATAAVQAPPADRVAGRRPLQQATPDQGGA